MDLNQNQPQNNTNMTIIEEKHCPPSESIKEAKEVNYDILKPWEKASKTQGLVNKGSELFVGNLSIETTEEDLFNTFQPYGEVIDVCIMHSINFRFASIRTCKLKSVMPL